MELWRRLRTLLYNLFEQQSVFSHPLHWLQQVATQVHTISQFDLLTLETERGPKVLKSYASDTLSCKTFLKYFYFLTFYIYLQCNLSFNTPS